MIPDAVKSGFVEGAWYTRYREYARDAHAFVEELHAALSQIDSVNLAVVDGNVRRDQLTPEVKTLFRRSDRLSTAARVFSAMSAEAFINLYGVVRLGESVYQKKLERQSILNKLDLLFLICESIVLEEKDEIRTTLQRLAEQRNALVHNKAKELDPNNLRQDDEIPNAAHEALRLMGRFFELFDELVPSSKPYLLDGVDPDD